MKKRVKLKKQKQQNQRTIHTLLSEISQTFTVSRKEIGNGYFIFDFGASSVCHFGLKETPEWKYGIWLLEDGFTVFGEHVELIDKFKPSRTYISHTNDIQGFLTSVQQVAENPKLYFVDSLTGMALVDFEETIDGEETWQTGYQVKRLYNDDTGRWDLYERDTTMTQEKYVEEKYEQFYKEKKEHEENISRDKEYAFGYFPTIVSLSEHIVGVGVRDQNKAGVICSPRYSIDVVVSNDLPQETVNELYDSLEKTIREKNYSDERKTYEHQFHLEGIYEGLDVLKESDYAYQ